MPDYGLLDKETGERKIFDRQKAWEITSEGINATDNAKEKYSIMGDFLDGIHENVRTKAVKESVGARVYGEKYTDIYNNEDRKKQLAKKGTEIWIKNYNAEKLEKEYKARKDKENKRIKYAIDKEGVMLRGWKKQALAAFMNGSSRHDRDLVRNANTKERMVDVLKECIRLFMQIDAARIDVSSEKKIAENAEELEKLSERYGAIRYLISTYPEEYTSISEDIKTPFERSFGKANVVVSYYRIKKRVMTDGYYRTHENKEISSKRTSLMTDEQRMLTELIWQSEGGLALFNQSVLNFVNKELVKKYANALKRDGAGRDRLEFQEKLKNRQIKLEKMGIASVMDEQLQEKRSNFQKGSLGVVGHARNMEKFELSGDPKKDIKILPKIMDQVELLRRAEYIKEKNENNYFIEQTDFQIRVADAALGCKDILQELETDLLVIAHLTKEGGIDIESTSAQVIERKRLYESHVREYTEKINAYRETRKNKDNVQRIPSNDRPYNNDKIYGKALEFDKNLSELVKDLTSKKFSDKAIYDNMARINGLLFIEPENVLLKTLSNRAEVLWDQRRLLTLERALKDKPDDEELKAEEKELKEKKISTHPLSDDNENYKNKDWEIMEDNTYEQIMKLRNEAEKMLYDFKDLKSVAEHYTEQNNWALNSEGTSDFTWILGPLLKVMHRITGGNRSEDHGEQKYDWAVDNLNMLPQEIKSYHPGDKLTLQRGDQEIVPVVDLSKHYGDERKDRFRTKCDALLNALDNEHSEMDQPDLRGAIVALKHYSEIRVAVTRDTTEMEMAFLDKFNKSVSRYINGYIKGKEAINYEEPVLKEVLDLYYEVNEMGKGGLYSQMSRAEFEAAKEQKAVYVDYGEEDEARQESNVKDIPLFLHDPNMNDIKQGWAGDCFFHSAITAVVKSNPDCIKNMFYDIGDGTVLVRLYMGYDHNNRRVDSEEKLKDMDTVIRPAYIRVRKDYDPGGGMGQDCMWVQLLEKAFASTGALHKKSSVDEKGKITGMQSEISQGLPELMLIHLTGEKNIRDRDKDELKKEFVVAGNTLESERMRNAMSGTPKWLWNAIWPAIKTAIDNEDPLIQERITVDDVVDIVKTQVNEVEMIIRNAIDEGKEELQKELKKNNIESDIDKDYKVMSDKLIERYLNPLATVPDKIRENLLGKYIEDETTEDYADIGSVIEGMIKSYVKGGEEKGTRLEAAIEKMEMKSNYYDPIKREKNISDEEYKEWVRRARNEAEVKNLAPLMKKYTREELLFMLDIRDTVDSGGAVTYHIPGHAMDIVDLEFYNGRWFGLVRDTNCIAHAKYTKNQDGSLKRNIYSGRTWKNYVRNLDGNLRTTVFGTSWYELKDLYKQMESYAMMHKIDNRKANQ